MNRDFQGLEVFEALHRVGSVTGAAQSLGVTKAAVSQTLSQLEADLGVRLFHRSTRGMHPTQEGLLFADQVLGPLRALREAREGLGREPDQPRGHLRITAPHVCLEWVLLPALLRLQQTAPEVSVEIDLNDAFVDIAKQGFDVGLRLSSAVALDMVGRRIAPEQACAVVAAPSFLAQVGKPLQRPSDLIGVRQIGYAVKGQVVPWEFGRGASIQRLAPQAHVVFNNPAAVMMAARAGAGLAYAIPRAQVAQDLAEGRLQEVLPGQATPLEPLMLYYPSRRYLPSKVKAFCQALGLTT